MALVRSPRAAAASTNPRPACACVAERMMRATSGSWISATPTTRTVRLEPKPVTSTNKKRSAGSDSRTSAERISTGSSSPREYPAASPTTRPPAYASSTERPASAITLRPPQRMRESTSRPRKSVPSSASALGPSYGIPIGRAGACGATNGPNRATSRTSTSTAAPTAPAPLRAKRSDSGTSRPQLRHEGDDDEVGDDVHGDVHRGDHDRDRLHGPHVADGDRVDELLPDAG